MQRRLGSQLIPTLQASLLPFGLGFHSPTISGGKVQDWLDSIDVDEFGAGKLDEDVEKWLEHFEVKKILTFVRGVLMTKSSKLDGIIALWREWFGGNAGKSELRRIALATMRWMERA